MLRSVLQQQDPITLTSKQPTLHGSPLQTEVIAAAGPHRTKLKTTNP